MRPPKTIMAATDFSPLADVGVDVAVVLARRTRAKLQVVHVLDPITPMYPAQFASANLEAIDKTRREKAMAKLETVAAKDVAISRELRDGFPSRELVAAAESSNADLIVIASHGYGPILRAVLGSVTSSLIRMSKVPVLVVGPERRNLDFNVVLAAVDLSPTSRDVLELARTYVAPEGTVEAVSFVGQSMVMVDDLLPYYPTTADLQRVRSQRIEAVRALIRDDGPDIHVDAIAKAPPALGILESAEVLGADLVVVGTSGHNAWHRAFIGSTATRVLAQAQCPVLVVPSQKEKR